MNSSRKGLDVISVLQIVFIVLKLCKLISWRWMWVLSPTWGSMIIGIACVMWAEIKWKWGDE